MTPARLGLRRLAHGALCGCALLAAPRPLSAQEAGAVAPAADSTSLATTAALTGALIVAGAGGAHLVGSPTAWPRSWPGFRNRVADQTGFYLVQVVTSRSLERATGYRPDATPCPRDALARCAFTATFTAVDRQGRRRVNAPLVASILVGTGASLLWRPERQSLGQSWAFAGTRVGITVGGFVAERMLVDWWAHRRGQQPGSQVPVVMGTRQRHEASDPTHHLVPLPPTYRCSSADHGNSLGSRCQP